MNYPQDRIKYWSLDDQYITEMIINWKCWSVVWLLGNIQNECKNNKRLVWSNDGLTTESVEGIIKIPIYDLTFEYDQRSIPWQPIDFINDNII